MRSMRGVRLVQFGDYELDIRAGELRRSGDRVRLQEQPYRILTMLLQRPGEVVLREEIQKRLWPNDTVVEVGHGINAAVQRLREALGDSAERPTYVETVARRGYRFRGETQVVYRSSNPAVRTGSQDLTGQSIAHYRICERLGGGGMGVVYRAEDRKLGRTVALKFLPPELASDPAAVSRFDREARAASALNHPNICTVYAVVEHAGQPVIVMEYLEGESLEAALARGPLDASAVLAAAIPMAAALEAAHAKGIVHRDLKPGNVFLTPSGVKILDFGLARMDQPARSEPEGHVTQDGSVLGTPQYMSPEQAEGRSAGAASDIYSLGLVIFEMLTGRRSRPALPDASLSKCWSALLERCLARNPEERWRSAGDLKSALEQIPAAGPWTRFFRFRMPSHMQRPRLEGLVYPAIPFAMLILLSVTWFFWPKSRKETAEPPPLTRFEVSLPAGMAATRLSLSPDGRSVAFVAGNRLAIRSFDVLEPRVLSEVEGMGTPFWSPDGQQIAVASGGKLRIQSLLGGAPSVVSDINTNLAGAWGSDGTILIGMVGDGIFRVPAAGGTPARVTTVDTAHGETRHMLPQFLPGGRRFLYLAAGAKAGSHMLFAGSLDSAERTPILTLDSGAEFVPSRPGSQEGYLLFARAGSVLAQAFDAGKLKTSGRTIEIASGVATNPALGAAVEIAHFSAAGSTLAYVGKTGQADPAPPVLSQPVAARQVVRRSITVVQNWIAGLPR